MKTALLFPFATTLLAAFTSTDVVADSLEIRRLAGGLLQVQAKAGLTLAIRPNDQSKDPADLKAQRTFVLGTEFERVLLKTNGSSVGESAELSPGEAMPSDLVSIESAAIGTKIAGIQLQMKGVSILIASVDLLSDQGWITTHRDQDINLVVLTFKNAAKLQTARFNLWIGLVKTQQIALNPTTAFSRAAADKFFNSISRKASLPDSVESMPMLTVPDSHLDFGDRQVVLLSDPD